MKLNIVPYEDTKFDNERWVDGTIAIDNVSVTYLQNSDCSGDDGDEEVQELTITARNNGVARFLNIKTKSWSIDDISELSTIIDDFKVRASMFDKEENIQENGN